VERPKICKASRIISAGSQSECSATLETHAELHTTQICQKKILFHPFFLIFLGNYRLHEAQPGQKVFAASDVRGNDTKPTGARTFLLSNIMPPKLCNLCFEPVIFMHLCNTHCQRMHGCGALLHALLHSPSRDLHRQEKKDFSAAFAASRNQPRDGASSSLAGSSSH